MVTRGIPTSYDIPTVKLGRFAVDKNFQGKKFGKILLKDAFKRVLGAAVISGVKGVEVFAKNNQAIGFYRKFGFVNLTRATPLMFLPIETIRSATFQSNLLLDEIV